MDHAGSISKEPAHAKIVRGARRGAQRNENPRLALTIVTKIERRSSLSLSTVDDHEIYDKRSKIAVCQHQLEVNECGSALVPVN